MANVSTPLMFVGGAETGTALAGVAGTGTALSGATAIPGGVNLLNSATGNTAYTLPNGAGVGQMVYVGILSSSTASALIFPPTSTTQIVALGTVTAAGGSVTLAANHGSAFVSLGSGNWMQICA